MCRISMENFKNFILEPDGQVAVACPSMIGEMRNGYS